jgi:hypothetical protein
MIRLFSGNGVEKTGWCYKDLRLKGKWKWNWSHNKGEKGEVRWPEGILFR